MLLAYESKFQILLDSYRRKSENNLRKLEEVLLELLLEPTDRNNHTCPIKSCDQKQTHSSNKIKSRQMCTQTPNIVLEFIGKYIWHHYYYYYCYYYYYYFYYYYYYYYHPLAAATRGSPVGLLENP